MNISKQDIYTLNIAHWDEYDNDQFLEIVDNSNLINHSSWLLPQLVAHFGRWQLYSTGKDTVVANCKTALDRVFYRLTRIRRSLLIKNQTHLPEYGQITPLIMLGFKRYQGKTYESFRHLEGLKWILEPLLYESIVDEPIELDNDRLLAIRQQGLLYNSGEKLRKGLSRNPESTWQLFNIKNTELGNSPKLLQSMLCQIWLAHPKHRRETMILDPQNWDNMPQPLVTAEIFEQPVSTITEPQVKTWPDLPWLDENGRDINTGKLWSVTDQKLGVRAKTALV